MDKLDNLLATAMNEVLESNEKDGASETMKTLRKNDTFPVFFRVAFAVLVDAMKKISSENHATQASAAANLKSWASSVRLLSCLVSAVKKVNKQTVLMSCLKYGRFYVDVFLKYAMPVLDKNFKHYHTECQNLLKNLQSSTRTLQHVCTHAKVSRNASLSNYIPAMKKTLEALLYRVKAMLAANGCVGAFWLGNLRNKNLQGDAISDSEDADSVSSEELAVEEDDDVTVFNEDSNVEEISVSPDY